MRRSLLSEILYGCSFQERADTLDRQETRGGGLLVTCGERVVILWEAAATLFP